MLTSQLSLKQRLAAVFVNIILLELLSVVVTGSWLPDDSGKSLWFFSAIGFYFFTHLSSPYFTAPRDSLANAATSALLLATTDLSTVQMLYRELNVFRWMSLALSIAVVIFALVAIITYDPKDDENKRKSTLSKSTFRLSNFLGRGQIMFSPPILISIVGFYQNRPITQAWLFFAWAILVFVEPVTLVIKIIGDFNWLSEKDNAPTFVGEIERVDDPNIIRVNLREPDSWERSNIHIVHLPDNRQVEILPLFIQLQDTGLIGTGLYHKPTDYPVDNTEVGRVYFPEAYPKDASQFLSELHGSEYPADLIGFVIENSEISKIWFEVSSQLPMEEGWLVFVRQDEQIVYYQILKARTKEESFSQNPRGTRIVVAEQLGILDEKKGFVKYGWLPSMNTPVFLPKEQVEITQDAVENQEIFSLGHIPNSKVGVFAEFREMLEYHTAILGVTGTGKTELAFDIIRHALSRDVKVFCVDFTGEYKRRLADLSPAQLGLDIEQARTLQERLFDVETGQYSASDEKKALKEFIDEITPGIRTQVDKFLTSDGSSIGIFEVEEIANTKASLRATELYLSTIFKWAQKNRRKRQILLVLEEAHTIVPETNLYGFDKVETNAVVGRMAQIALQGRKYGVGLLLISQRTALVSKTLLSQCNTVFCFALHDETGIRYLGNVFSSEYVSAIPNLKFLHGIAFGKAVLSERPIIFEVPYDANKEKASKSLDEIATQPRM